MQLIAGDIGNSSTKVAVQDLDEDRDVRWFSQITLRGNEPVKIDLTEIPGFWSICSVNQKRFARLQQWIEQYRRQDHVHQITENEVDIRTQLRSRQQIGLDRLVAAWMALELDDEQGPIVVVDAGTAVTIDLVDAQGVFQGGVIFPGASANLRCLSTTAPALPDLSQQVFGKPLDDVIGQIIGKETQSSIVSGVYHAQISAITQITNRIGQKTSQPFSVYATGGGVFAIEKYLPDNWQFVPDLVLRGAKTIGQRLLSKKMVDK